ncbi:MAG: CotH kinase family protein [Methylococcales bacterium]|nr:CotH kinase family protein [Methylococcales bacterium]
MNINFTFKKLIIISIWASSVSMHPASATAVLVNVFSPLLTDIIEPTGIYFPLTSGALRADVRTSIRSGPCIIGNYSGCTLADVNADNNSLDNFKPEIKVHIALGTFPDDGQNTNATLRQRGNSARDAEQKSYRIKLDSKDNLWRGERKLQLNKHPWDLSRINNKLSFDLMQDMPHLPSLRTDFVNMFVDNVDYGLFTHVENVGKEYLIRRGWHKDSGIYKANNVDFFMSGAYTLDGAGKPINPQSFNSKLEIKRGKDHRKFLEMLGALNNGNNDFSNDVMGKYFNKNNYLSWVSASILFGNQDIVSSNFYLLNRKNEDTFYFLPWDYDETWESINPNLSRAWNGVSGYWSSLLHRRYLQQPGAIDELLEAIKVIKNNYVTPVKIASKLDAYLPVIQTLISSQPDIDDLPVIGNGPYMTEYFANYNNTYTSVQRNHKIFIDSIQYPMGFWVDKAQLSGNKLSMEWTSSYDLQGDNIKYDIQIATSPDFSASTIVAEIKGLSTTKYDYNWSLPENDYYLRIIARDDDNPSKHWQFSYDEYIVNKNVYPGVVSLQGQVNPEPEPVTPYCDMMFDPQVVRLGQETELSWWIDDATTATIDNNVGNVAIPTAEIIMVPTQTTTYTLTAEGSGGSTVCQATVVVQ